MDNSKSEMRFKHIEVAIPVKKNMPSGKTESCDETVDRLPDGNAARAKRTIVPRGSHGDCLASCIEDFKVREVTPYALKGSIVADALQYLAQNDVRKAKTLPIHLAIKPFCVRI